MVLSGDTIRFLHHNFLQLRRQGSLEAMLPVMEAMKVIMTSAQFELAIHDLRMSADNQQVARQFLVEGVSAAQLREAGVSASRLSKVLARVFANFNRQLETLDLVNESYTLDRQTAALVRELETAQLANHLPAGGRDARSARRKARRGSAG